MAMKGTEKQAEWADTIRIRFLETLDKRIARCQEDGKTLVFRAEHITVEDALKARERIDRCEDANAFIEAEGLDLGLVCSIAIGRFEPGMDGWQPEFVYLFTGFRGGWEG